MNVTVEACPVCAAQVVNTANGVRLEVPAVDYDEVTAPWSFMVVGPRVLASVGDPPPNGRGHVLHAHQPEDDPVPEPVETDSGVRGIEVMPKNPDDEGQLP